MESRGRRSRKPVESEKSVLAAGVRSAGVRSGQQLISLGKNQTMQPPAKHPIITFATQRSGLLVTVLRVKRSPFVLLRSCADPSDPSSQRIQAHRQFPANFSHLSHLRAVETLLDEGDSASGLLVVFGVLVCWFLFGVWGLLVFLSPSSRCVSFPFIDDLDTPPTRRPYS